MERTKTPLKQHFSSQTKWAVATVLLVGVLVITGYIQFISAPTDSATTTYVVVRGAKNADVSLDLKSRGIIRSVPIFVFLLGNKDVLPGGYRITAGLNVWQVVNIFRGRPVTRWVTIPEGLRKEEIADLLASSLGWTAQEKTTWITTDTTLDADHVEGVYFPDTYLIPVDESPRATANRLRAKFEEKFAPFAAAALQENIRWPTLLKVASLIQKEAGGKSDMKLISGIIWNRLLRNMKLDIDATLQYVRGSEEHGWWPKVRPEDKTFDSPFNTYRYVGLPPHPIDNPGLDAIDAALHPEKTDCFYYLHDANGSIHCSKTYEEHLKNIDTYLR